MRRSRGRAGLSPRDVTGPGPYGHARAPRRDLTGTRPPVSAGGGAGCGVRGRAEGDLPACVEVLRAVHEQDGYPLVWPSDPAA